MSTQQQEILKMLPGSEMEEKTIKKKGNTVITLGVNNTGFNFALSTSFNITLITCRMQRTAIEAKRNNTRLQQKRVWHT